MENYISGYYYQDLINAFTKNHNVFLYGRGYKNYNLNDSFQDILYKSKEKFEYADLIVVSNSWGNENPDDLAFDPHPNVDLAIINNIPKVFFLNKEYKKIVQKLHYIKESKFDLICTVYKDHEKWSNETGCKFITLPFGVDLDTFKPLGLKRKYDFSFTGALHRSYGVEVRYEVKKRIFKTEYIDSLFSKSKWIQKNLLQEKYHDYNIYWAEWGSKSLFGNSLAPSYDKYITFLNKKKFFLNTLSAQDIFNPRFFELMATKTLIFCPKSVESYGILKDNHNAIMFNDNLSDFDEKLQSLISGKIDTTSIIENAYFDVQMHSYQNRIDTVINALN